MDIQSKSCRHATPWCGPCKMMSPVLEAFEPKYGNTLKVAKINVDENPQTTESFAVMAIPTLVLFRDGVVVDQVTGYRSKDQLKAWVRAVQTCEASLDSQPSHISMVEAGVYAPT
ncbi:thioredoxin family protein [Alicyclobacillus herbarius]|uniref:thioredoxin family protein n=1 Tax=Alicyclobacillus herbarius TaxID=122960 RepID=UPI00248042A5|nr:thioredoxin domain-containing protein [Alicyclobacillus herbarius]